MVRRRVRREPVAYILGRKGFRRIELAVDRAGADPAARRPSCWSRWRSSSSRGRCSTSAPARARSRSRSPTSCPAAEVVATDTSLDALAVAQANARAARARRAGRARARERSPSGPLRPRASPTCPTSPRREWEGLAPEIARVRAARGAGRRARPGSRRSRRCSAELALAVERAGGDRARGRRGAGGDGRPSSLRRAGFERVEVPAATSPGSSASWSAGDAERLDRADGVDAAARRSSVHRRRRRRLSRRRPLRARLRPARRGRDRAHPRAQGPRRRQALGGHVLLAAGDARAGRGARPAHPRRARRAAAGPGDPGGRQPRAPLPARLPRGSRAARGAADRGAARGARLPRSSRPRPTAPASPPRRASTTSTRRSSPGPTWRSTAASSPGSPRPWSTSPRSRTAASR